MASTMLAARNAVRKSNARQFFASNSRLRHVGSLTQWNVLQPCGSLEQNSTDEDDSDTAYSNLVSAPSLNRRAYSTYRYSNGCSASASLYSMIPSSSSRDVSSRASLVGNTDAASTFELDRRQHQPSSSLSSPFLDLVRHPRNTLVAQCSRNILANTSLYHKGNHSRAFQRTMHSVVWRASFSTSPKKVIQEQTSASPKSDTHKATPNKAIATIPKPMTPDHDEENRSMVDKTRDAITSATKAIVSFILKIPGVIWFYLRNPSAFRERMIELKDAAKKEAHHYWMGTKLLVADVRTARQIMERTFQGTALSRRERKQLLRTVSDLFRLVPMSMFVLIPFMEFALPFALKLFPNMLPSTFQDSLKAEENMKRELKLRIGMAQFFQETLHDLAKEQKKRVEKQIKKIDGDDQGDSASELVQEEEQSARSMIEFLEKARMGEMMPAEVIIKFSSFFHDDLTLDNMPRMQLVNMCKYMSIAPYGAESFLRFQLRNRIRILKEDDQRILWEGIESLTKMELREACQERGMRSTGLSKNLYREALQQWLDLSVNQKVPVSLLIMSRTFFLRDGMSSPTHTDKDGSKSVAGLADAISGLDREVVNEVVLQVATSEEQKSDPNLMKLKLEVLEQQNELIAEEREERDAAAKKKEQQEKMEKAEIAEETPKPVELVTLESRTKGAAVIPKVESSIDMTQEEATPLDGSSKKPADVTTPNEDDDDDDDENNLSSEEIEAISQLVSPDPVRQEREELERIKMAMRDEEDQEELDEKLEECVSKVEAVEGTETADATPSLRTEPMTSEEADKLAKKVIAEMYTDATKHAEEGTMISLQGLESSVNSSAGSKENNKEEYSTEDRNLDRAIERLKSKLNSMVGKIEVQMSDIEIKIGDKLHLLDKDGDGILTREEMTAALQQVLKRNLTFEEAMEIAADMDGNEDGIFTIGELAQWLESHKIIKLVEEGRDADLDRILAKNQTYSQKEDMEMHKEETK